MSKRIKVYTASKLHHAPLWKRLREEWPEVEFTARWPVLHVGTTPDEPAFATVFWDHDMEDVARSNVVLVYAEEGEHLRGALVEAGAALAVSLDVIVVGDHPDYGTWQYHRYVHRVPNLEHARVLLRTMRMTLEDVE